MRLRTILNLTLPICLATLAPGCLSDAPDPPVKISTAASPIGSSPCVYGAMDRVDNRIHPARVNYYEKAIRAMMQGDAPQNALWPLLVTWTLAVDVLPEHAVEAWRLAVSQLGFTASGFESRVEGLDRFLDDVEELLDELAKEHGLETSTSI